jgi:hypothetical protein
VPAGDAYTRITVVPFQLSKDVTEVGVRFGEDFAGDIVAQLRADHPDVFEEVRWKNPAGQPGEAVLSGKILKFHRGSAALRAVVGFGSGAASFEGEATLKDASTGEVLLVAPFDKLWAWGGMLGASKTVDNMVAQTSIAIAKTIALWKEGALAD